MRNAFADGLQLLWKVLAGLGGAGLLASLLMREVPMHVATDEKWALRDRVKDNEKSSEDNTLGSTTA